MNENNEKHPNIKLKDWYINYRQNRDLMFKRIKSFEDHNIHLLTDSKKEFNTNHLVFTITHKNDMKEYIVVCTEPMSIADLIEYIYSTNKLLRNQLHTKSYENEKTKPTVVFVTHNSTKNIKALIKEWEKVIPYEEVTVVFANPDAKDEKHWLIKPAIHHRITEKSALKQGIMSIAGNVEKVD